MAEPPSEELPSLAVSILSSDTTTNVSATTAPVQVAEPGSPLEPKPSHRKRKPKGPPPMQLPEPLTALPTSTKLPDLDDFNFRAVQLKNPLFVAICKVLIIYGNAWQSAMDLVDGIRHFNLASLGGRTPKGTIQGAISTALALSAALRTFEPIEKQRMNSTTYYRMDARALEPPSSEVLESDAADLAAAADARRKSAPTSSSKQKKRKPVATWDSDSMSSESSDEDAGKSSNNSKSSKRARTGSPSSSSSRSKTPAIPNGLKKLPKGYVYDTEINQAALMGLSINPSQTGEGQQALENDFPDRRSQYGVDLSQEPSMFAVEQQTGYTYPRLRTSGRERLPKVDCEDGYAVADLKNSDGYLGRLFCITDGHGGRACSSFVIATIPGAMQVILGRYKPSDFSSSDIQELVKKQITDAIRLIDKEYLDYKKHQYLLYKAKKIPQDPGSDGTTLIVNIFIDKWVICVNVGDSRSILGSRDSVGRWNVNFHSEDHTPSLERLAQTIYANGGEFVTHDDKVIKFDPNIKNDKKHRQSLKEARIRVKDGASNLYGIPYRTRNGQCASINLGACIGDVLYKLDPVNPVLSCKPDITFIDITTIQNGYLLMASDGLWDYVLRGGKVQDQNATVCQFVGDKIDRGWNHQRIVCTLSDREGMTGLYSDSIQEYDDFTAILVTINNQHLVAGQQDNVPQTHTEMDVETRMEVDTQLQGLTQDEGELEGKIVKDRQVSDSDMQDQSTQDQQDGEISSIQASETLSKAALEPAQEGGQDSTQGFVDIAQEAVPGIVPETTVSEMIQKTVISEVPDTTMSERVPETTVSEASQHTAILEAPQQITTSEVPKQIAAPEKEQQAVAPEVIQLTETSGAAQQTETLNDVRLTETSKMVPQTTFEVVQQTTSNVIEETPSSATAATATKEEEVDEEFTTAETVIEIVRTESVEEKEEKEAMVFETTQEMRVSEVAQEPAKSDVVQDTSKLEEVRAQTQNHGTEQSRIRVNRNTSEREGQMEVDDDDGAGDSTLSDIDIENYTAEQEASQSEEIDIDVTDGDMSEDIDVDSTS
ncbi:Protein phosphatase 1L [Haplosporangium sp. Z 27]|nr:Protein phosphatase 1L [Haplosporangium sp. Z 27]